MNRPCSHSISRRLSLKLALVTMLVLGGLCAASWMAISMMVKAKNADDLAFRSEVIARILATTLKDGDEAACLARVRADAPMRADTRLELWRADGSLLHADAPLSSGPDADHSRSVQFEVPAPQLAGGVVRARYTMDFTRDHDMGRRWAAIQIAATLAAGLLVAAGTFWHVRRQLRPLRALASQTQAISLRRLDQRLSLADPAEELLPWIEQFNGLMGRLEGAVAQLEGFNADVAHELRTPLTALIGQTELALSRERSADTLREVLAGNLEELQRLGQMVNDMLFLSQADRGATARRGEPVSLAALAHQVVDFHEAVADEAGVRLLVEGDVQLPVDEALFKRAVANLLGNAVRFAERGTTVTVRIAPERADRVEVTVQNAGPTIDPQALPRLFDRFFRADTARFCDGQTHHGLGLAIVAAIARMHAGTPVAQSEGGLTRVGFTLAAG